MAIAKKKTTAKKPVSKKKEVFAWCVNDGGDRILGTETFPTEAATFKDLEDYASDEYCGASNGDELQVWKLVKTYKMKRTIVALEEVK